MSTTDIPQIVNLVKTIDTKKCSPKKEQQQVNSTNTDLGEEKSTSTKKPYENSHSSDSGKSSSCSPVGLDCSFDSGIAGVLLDTDNMELHKRIQQCQCILLALERDREYFYAIRNRLSKITHRKKKESNENEFFCNVCCAEIDPEDDKTFVKCYICNKYICRNIKCAEWLPKSAQWECELCQSSKESLAQTSSWVAEQITFHQEKLIHPPRARSEIYIPISECNDSSIHFESVSQIGANSTTITAEQKLKIREYVEEVVAKLLGGNLDTIAVNQLSKSENYLPDPKLDNSHNGRMSAESMSIKANGHDFSDISETRLRQMIQKIIAETINLPPLSNGHAVSEISLDRRSKAADNRPLSNGYQRHRTEHYFEPTIYQDLLATAVINKIVDKKLNNNHEDSITDIVGGTGGDGDDLNDNIGNTETDQNFNIEKSSTTSGSSVEPHSDCSYPEIEQILNTNDDKSSELLRNSDRDSVMSDYLASHLIPLPDLNAMATESDEDDYMSVTSSAIGDGTWEKNWLFKKKRTTLSGSVTANSIGIVVPDPKEDVRAQIGDKTADEVSDLSELGSDTDDSLDSLRSKLEPINDRLINKHIIGGQNNKMILDELIERSSMISNTLPSGLESPYMDTCNEHVIDAPTKNEAINDNVTQQTSAMEQKVSPALQDHNSNSLTASDDSTESIGCIGFSSIEIIDPNQDIPSVVEILAAMTLGPMLAVPSCDQPAALTISDYNAFTDLKELALAEIKARSLELTPRNLDVIPEETSDIINQTENVIDNNEELNAIASDKIYIDSSEPKKKLNTLNESNDNDLEIVIGDIQTTLIENIKRDTETNSLTFESTKSDNQEIVLSYDHQTIHSPDEIKSEMHINEKIETQNSTQQNELVIIDQISTELQDNSENSKCPEIKTNDMNSEIQNSNILDFAKKEESEQFLHSTETENESSCPTNEAKVSDILPDDNLNCIKNNDISAAEEQHSQSEIEEKKLIEEEFILKKNPNELQIEITTDSTSINHSLEYKVNESISDEHSLEVGEATSSADPLETQHKESDVDISNQEVTISIEKMPEEDASETQLENTTDNTKNETLNVEATSLVDPLETQNKESEVYISNQEATIATAKMPEEDATETQLENTINTTKSESFKVEATSSVDPIETQQKESEVDISNQETTIPTVKMTTEDASESQLENTRDTIKSESLKVENSSQEQHTEIKMDNTVVSTKIDDTIDPKVSISKEEQITTQTNNTELENSILIEEIPKEKPSEIQCVTTAMDNETLTVEPKEQLTGEAQDIEQSSEIIAEDSKTEINKDPSCETQADDTPSNIDHSVESKIYENISTEQPTEVSEVISSGDILKTHEQVITEPTEKNNTEENILTKQFTEVTEIISSEHKSKIHVLDTTESMESTENIPQEHPSESQLEDTANNQTSTEENVSGEHLTIIDETMSKEQHIELQMENTLDSTKKDESISQEASLESKTEDNTLLNEQVSKDEPKNTSESTLSTSRAEEQLKVSEGNIFKEELSEDTSNTTNNEILIEDNEFNEHLTNGDQIISKEDHIDKTTVKQIEDNSEQIEEITTSEQIEEKQVTEEIIMKEQIEVTEENISSEKPSKMNEVISSEDSTETKLKINPEIHEKKVEENNSDHRDVNILTTSAEQIEEKNETVVIDLKQPSCDTQIEDTPDSKQIDDTSIHIDSCEESKTEENISVEKLSEMDEVNSSETSKETKLIVNSEPSETTTILNNPEHSEVDILSTSGEQIEKKEVTEVLTMKELSCDTQIKDTSDQSEIDNLSTSGEQIEKKEVTEELIIKEPSCDTEIKDISDQSDGNILSNSAEEIEEKEVTDKIITKEPTCDNSKESKTEDNISIEKSSGMDEAISSKDSTETKLEVNQEPVEKNTLSNCPEQNEVDNSHQQFATTTENIPETQLEENTKTTDYKASTVETMSDKHLTVAEESDSKEQHIEIQTNKANESQNPQESQDSTLVSEETSTGEGTVEQHSETQLDDTINDTNNKTSTVLSVAEEHVIDVKEIDSKENIKIQIDNTSESINLDNLTIQEEQIESKAEHTNNTNQETSTVLSVSEETDTVVEEIDCKSVIETQMDNSQNTDKLATQEETIEPKFDNNISVNEEISKENADLQPSLESTLPTSLQLNSEIVISDDLSSNNSEKIINDQPPKILIENLNNEDPSEAVTVTSENISIKLHSETQTDETSNSLKSYLSKHLNDDKISVKPTALIDEQTKEKDSENGTSSLSSKSEMNNIKEDRKELNLEYNTTSEMHHSETQTDDKELDLDEPNMELKTETTSVEQSEVAADVELLSQDENLEKASEEYPKSDDEKALDQQTKIQEEDAKPVLSTKSEFTDSKASEEHPNSDDEKALVLQTKIQEEDETPVLSTQSEFTDSITDEKFSHEKLLEEHSKLADKQDLDKQPSETEMENESGKTDNISDEQLSNKAVCSEYKMELKVAGSISTQSNIVNEQISNEKQYSEKLNECSADSQPKTEINNLDSMKSEENILIESPSATINEDNSLNINPDVTSDCTGEAQCNIKPCTVDRSSEVQSSSDILDFRNNENLDSMKSEDNILIESPLVTNEDNSLKTPSEFSSDSTEVAQSSNDNLDSTNNDMTLKTQTSEINEIYLKTEMEDQKLEEVNDGTSNSTKDTQSSNDNLDSASNENTSKPQTSDINEINLKTEIEDQQLELVADSLFEATKAINQNLMENKSHENSTVVEKDTPVNETALESNLENNSSADLSEVQKAEQSLESQVEKISESTNDQNDNSTTCQEGNVNIPTVDIVELNTDTTAEKQSTKDEIISKEEHCETQVEKISESTNVQNENSSECQGVDPSIDIVEDIVISKEHSPENEKISNKQNGETQPSEVSEDSSKLIDSTLQSENISGSKDSSSACLDLNPSEQSTTISNTISETLPEDISDSDKVEESTPIDINSSEKTIDNGKDAEKISNEVHEMHEHCDIQTEATLNSIKTEDSKCSECIEVLNVEGQKLDEQQTVVPVENIIDKSKSEDISESTYAAQIKLDDDKASATMSEIISEETILKTEDNPSGEHLTMTDEANLEAEKLDEKLESKEIVKQAVCQEEQHQLTCETISKEQQVPAINCDNISEEDLNVSPETIIKKINSEIQSDSSSETLKTEDSLKSSKEIEESENQTDSSNNTTNLGITYPEEVIETNSEPTITEIVKIESEDCFATMQSSKAEPENISTVLDEPLPEQTDEKPSEIPTENISNIQELKESNEQRNTDEIPAVEKSMQIEESSVCRKGGEKYMSDDIKSEETHLPEQAEVSNNEILENSINATDNESEKTVKSEDLLKSEEINEQICQVQNLESQTEGVLDSQEPLAETSEPSVENRIEKSKEDSLVCSDSVTESQIDVSTEKQTSELCDTSNSTTEIATDENPKDVNTSDLLKPSAQSKNNTEESHSINNEVQSEADLKIETTSDISTSNDQSIILSAPTEIETNPEVELVSTNKCDEVVEESIANEKTQTQAENISEFSNQSNDITTKLDLEPKDSSSEIQNPIAEAEPAEVIANEQSTKDINTIDQNSELQVETNVEIIKEISYGISNQTVECTTECNEQSKINDETNSTEQSVVPIISEEHSSQIVDLTKSSAEQPLTIDEKTHKVVCTKDKESELIEITRNTTESNSTNSLEQNSDIHIESNIITLSDISDNIEESIRKASSDSTNSIELSTTQHESISIISRIMELASNEAKLSTNIETEPEEISSTEIVSESQITIQEGLPKEESISIDESIQPLNDTSLDSTLGTTSKENKPNENSIECNETNNEQQLADVKHEPIVQISNENSSETKESIVESTQQTQESPNETNSIQPSEKQLEKNVQISLNETKSMECFKEESIQQSSLNEEINESTLNEISSEFIVVSKIEKNIANVLDIASDIQDSEKTKSMECSETQMETKESSPEVIVVESSNEENISKDQVNITKSENIDKTSQEKISLNTASEESNSLDQPLEIQIESNETITEEKSSEILDPITSSTTNENLEEDFKTPDIENATEQISITNDIIGEEKSCEISQTLVESIITECFQKEMPDSFDNANSIVQSFERETNEKIIKDTSLDSIAESTTEQNKNSIDSKETNSKEQPPIEILDTKAESKTNEIKQEISVEVESTEIQFKVNVTIPNENSSKMPDKNTESTTKESISNIDQPPEIQNEIYDVISKEISITVKESTTTEIESSDHVADKETQLAVKETIIKDTLSEIPEPIVESINKEINEPPVSPIESTAQEQSSFIVNELSEKIPKENLCEKSEVADSAQNEDSLAEQLATQQEQNAKIVQDKSLEVSDLIVESSSSKDESQNVNSTTPSEVQDHLNIIVESTKEEIKIQETTDQTITEERSVEPLVQPNEINSSEKSSELLETVTNEDKSETQDKHNIIVELTTEESLIQKTSEVTDQTIMEEHSVKLLLQPNEVISIEKTTEFSEATTNEEISVEQHCSTKHEPIEDKSNEIANTTAQSATNDHCLPNIQSESSIEDNVANDQSVLSENTISLDEKCVTVERNETSPKEKSSEPSDILKSNLNEPSVPQEETNSKEETSVSNEAISVEPSPVVDIGNASSDNTGLLVEKISVDKTSNETIPKAVTESPNIISEETSEIKLKTNQLIPEDNSDKITDLVIEATTKNNLTTSAALESKENISEIRKNIGESSKNKNVSNEEQTNTTKLDINNTIPEKNSNSIKDTVTNDHLLIADESNSEKEIYQSESEQKETTEKLGEIIEPLEESVLKDKSRAPDETKNIGQTSEILCETKDSYSENITEESKQNAMIPNEISPEISVTIVQQTNEEIVLNIQSDKIITKTQNKCETLTVLPEPNAQSKEISPEDKSVVIDIKTTKSVTESQSSKDTLSKSSAEHKTNESTTDKSALSIETNSEELLPATSSKVEVISLNIQSSEISMEGFSESISSGPVSEQLGSKVEYISEASTSVEQLEVCDKNISKEHKPVTPPEISIESFSESTSSGPVSEQSGSKVEYISEASTSDEQLEVYEKTISKEQKPVTPPATSSDKQSNLATSVIKEKSGIIKKLTRQYRVEDTPPSFEDVSPQIMPQTMPPSSTLADLCQKYINDKTLLTALENRRRRTLLMHRFLSTLDISHSSGDSMEETKNIHTEVLDSENPVVYENYNLSHDHESDRDDFSDTFIVQINDHSQVSYNFINTVLFSDQLSYDTKINDESRSNTVEEFINNDDEEDDDDENDNIAFNLTNTTTTNTLINSTTTNNSFTAINTKDINTNSNNNYNHKQTLTNISGYTPTSNQKYSNHNQLTSAVQNNETIHTTSTTRRLRKSRHHINDHQPIINIDHVNVEIVINESGSGLIKHNQGVDGDNKDEDEEDDDVALFRHFVPGSIAEREYKKWYNAVEMPNNPYAPEALKRRISGSQERFIDLPNISPSKDINPLDLLDNQKLENDENKTRESDYKRYSRDYYINSGVTSPQMSPALEVSTNDTKDNREPTKKQTPTSEKETGLDFYKATPAQVDQSGNSCYMDCISLSPTTELETNATTTSDSDTIKMNDIAKAQQDKEVTTTNEKEATDEDNNIKQRPTSLAFSKSESCGNVITPNRGSTPTAFKFLQPKRKLLEPNQVLSVDEDEEQTATSPSEKPVIEAEVVKALPSVKALAKAFLMTTNTTQPENRWLRKARTLSQSGKKTSPTPKRSLDIPMRSNLSPKIEDDITITSDLSSLETDSSSVGNELSSTVDMATSNESSDAAAASGNTIPVPVREGVLKNNIAFFENLKNKN